MDVKDKELKNTSFKMLSFLSDRTIGLFKSKMSSGFSLHTKEIKFISLNNSSNVFCSIPKSSNDFAYRGATLISNITLISLNEYHQQHY